ncbi:MAG: ribonuclease domain-containing protein [Bacilli bacterium]
MEKNKIKLNLKTTSIVISLLIFVIFILAFATRVTVRETKDYFSRNQVALYIYKYDKLPKNFVTKDYVINYLEISYPEAIKEGYNVGGDTYDYSGNITDITNYQYLKEADIYSNRDAAEITGRGQERLVFNVYGKTKVFYTSDHYGSFEVITKFSINLVSNIFWILFILLSFLEIYIIYVKNKKEKQIINEVKQIEEDIKPQ